MAAGHTALEAADTGLPDIGPVVVGIALVDLAAEDIAPEVVAPAVEEDIVLVPAGTAPVEEDIVLVLAVVVGTAEMGDTAAVEDLAFEPKSALLRTPK